LVLLTMNCMMNWNYFIFCQFFLGILRKLFVPWHVVIHHFRYLYTKIWRKLTFIGIRISNNLTSMQMMLVFTIFEFFIGIESMVLHYPLYRENRLQHGPLLHLKALAFGKNFNPLSSLTMFFTQSIPKLPFLV